MPTGLSKFAKLARSVTRSRSVLASQFSSHIPVVKETSKQSNLAHVCCSTNVVCILMMQFNKLWDINQIQFEQSQTGYNVQF